MSHNGYTNYATWNVDLWIDNCRDTYDIKCEYLLSLRDTVKPDQVQHFLNLYVRGGLTSDIKGNDWKGGRVQDIDLDDLAATWEVERQELLSYA